MRSALAACAAIPLIAAVSLAQSRPPDLSGRWQLVEPTAAERALDTLAITAPDELLIRQTPLEIIVEHPSRSGTHPEAGTFQFGSGGFVGSSMGAAAPLRGTWGVTHIGTQLMISRTTTYPPDERGERSVVARGSMWRLEVPDRLVIEFGEERAGERPKIATRVYVKFRQP